MSQIENIGVTGIPFKTGTENHGFLYESQVMTFLAAKFANDPTVSDFELLTNPAEINCFEDILLRVLYKNGRAAMYVVQIKHSKNRLLIAKNKIRKQKCMVIDLKSYYQSFVNIREIATTSSQGPLQKFLTSVDFENYYFCILTTISEPDEDTKLSEIKVILNQDLELLNMGKIENCCYQLDRNVYLKKEYENFCCEQFASKLYIFLNQPNYNEIIAKLSGTSNAIKHFSQPMANDLVSLIKEHSVTSKAGLVVCDVLNKEKFAQLCLQVILCNSNMSIYTAKAKPIDEKYMKAWDKICSSYQFISIDEGRTDVLLPMLASYYEYCIRKYTEKALEKVLRVDNRSTEGNISLKNHQFTWDDRQMNGFQLDYWLREAFKILGISALNLRDLLPELWRRNEIPIIVEMSVANIIINLIGSNTKNRFLMVSSGNTPFEAGTGAFRNLLDLRDGPASANLPELLDIKVSLQGRCPVPLKYIVRNNPRILQLITSSDILSWIAKDSPDRKIGLPLKETINNYVTRKFNIPIKKVAMTEGDIVRELKNSNLTIISNDPGMGKTTVLTSLARKCDPIRYVIIHDLAQCKLDLQDLTSDIHEDPIRYFYNKTQTEKNALVEGILQQHIDEKSLVVFLDSFDEILPVHQDTVLKVVEMLLAMDAHVFITSRTQAEHLLRSKFKNVISNYVSLANIDSNDIRDYFDRLGMPKHMWGKLPETFLSIPLHLQMLSIIYKNDTENTIEQMNTTQLYKTFMEEKINIFFYKKNIHEQNTHYVLSYLVKGILNTHYTIALVYLFSLERIIQLGIVTTEEWEKELCIFEEYKLSLGIVSTVKPNIQFTHKTFSEYLVAEYITINPETSVTLYKDVATSANLEQTYKFLHEMRLLEVEKGTIIAYIINDQEEEILNTTSINDSWNKKDKTWGMYPIHWAAVCCFMAVRSRTENLKCFETLSILLQKTSELVSILSDSRLEARQSIDGRESLEARQPFDLKDKYLDWTWLNFMIGQSSKTYIYFKQIIHFLQSTYNINIYLKCKVEENIDMQYIDSDGYSLGELAVRNSDREVLDYLLNRASEFDYSRRDKFGRNILHHACLVGNQEIVDLIIDSKPAREFIEAQDNNGWDALHYACDNGHQKLVGNLLRRDLNVNKQSYDGTTPFQLACKTNNTDFVKYLLELNVNPSRVIGSEELKALHKASGTFNKLLKEKYCNIRKSNPNEPEFVYVASLKGNVQIIDALINMGFYNDDMDIDKKSALRFACFKGIYKAEMYTLHDEKNPPPTDQDTSSRMHSFCCGEISSTRDIEDFLNDKRLIKYVEFKDSTGMDTLHYACSIGNKKVVEVMLKLGFNVNKKSSDGGTTLHFACKTNASNLVQYLIEQNVNVNATFGKEKKCALHEACLHGNFDVVKVLLEEEHCEHTQVDRYGSRALHYAAKGGNVQTMDILVKMGMNSNEVNSSKVTPLHYACAQGHFEAVTYLLDNGADPQLVDEEDRNCLHFACGGKESDAKDIVDFLIDKNLIINIKDKDRNGWDALHYACKKGNRKIAEVLLKRGFDVNMENNRNETPLHMACGTNDVSLVKCLIENGADIKAASHGKTAVHFAAEGGNVEILEALIKKGLKSDIIDFEQQTPLHLACREGHYEAVAFLLDKWDNPLAPDKYLLHFASMGGNSSIVDLLLNSRYKIDVNEKGLGGRSPLHYAAEKENVDVVNKLLERGADPNAAEDDLNTPLHLACKKGHVEIVKVLMEADADVHIESKDGSTSMHRAVEGGNVDVVNKLLARGANPNVTRDDLTTPLHLACEKGHTDEDVDVVKALMDASADVHATEKDGWTPLLWACKEGHFEIVKILMNANAYVDVTGKDGWTPMHYATAKGNVEVVNKLLERGANPNATEENLITPLHLACENGHFEIVKILMATYDDVDIKDTYGWTPLHYAAWKDHVDIVQTLLALEANPNATDNVWSTPLHLACNDGNVEMVKTLIEAKADVHMKHKDGWTPLHYAAENGNIDVVNKLLARKANPNATGNDLNSPLHLACGKGHVDIVNILMESKADLHIKGKDGWTPLHYTAEEGSVDLVNNLLVRGANPNTTGDDLNSPLHLACEKGHVDIVKILMEAKADLHIKGKDGWTPLHCAVEKGTVDVVKILLARGANSNASGDELKRPIHLACEKGHFEIFNILMAIDEDIHIQDAYRWTPLHYAAWKDHVDIVQTLLARGANPNAVDNVMWTPLLLACQEGHFEIVKILVEANADVDMKDDNGWTPLHYAADKGNVDVVNKLMARGANPSATENDLKTPLHLACGKGHVEIVKILMKANADVQIKAKYGWTPLHYASEGGNVDVVNTLLARGANRNATGDDMKAPLHLACENGHLEIVKILMATDEDFDIKDKYGWTPLHYAEWKNHVDITQTLLARGAKPNATDVS